MSSNLPSLSRRALVLVAVSMTQVPCRGADVRAFFARRKPLIENTVKSANMTAR